MRCCTVAHILCLGHTNMKCFSCGEPVCEQCSIKAEYHGYGVKRLCVLPCFRYLAEDVEKYGKNGRRVR